MWLVVSFVLAAVGFYIWRYSRVGKVLPPVDHQRHTVGMQHASEVRILTYNIFMRPPLVHNNANDYKNERLEEFLKVMDQFDVVALQEMFSSYNTRVKKLFARARALGFVHQVKCVSPGSFSRFVADGGVVILSKFPIVETDAHIFKDCTHPDALAAKQVIYAKILVKKGTAAGSPSSAASEDLHLHFFTTHLQSSHFSATPQQNLKHKATRMKQVVELGKFVRAKLHKDHSGMRYAVITGDLNVDSRCHVQGNEGADSEEYKEMMRLLDPEGELTIVDLLKEAHDGLHPITIGDYFHHPITSEKVPLEVVLTEVYDHLCNESKDYILFVKSKHVDNPNHHHHPHLHHHYFHGERVRVRPKATKVEHFFVKKKPFTQLSDHYGVSTVLHLPSGDDDTVDNRVPNSE